MPRPYLRSRTMKRTLLHTPGGTPTIHYRRAPRNLPRCEGCGAILAGISSTDGRLPKSSKRVSRKGGGRLCHNCTAMRIRATARGV